MQDEFEKDEFLLDEDEAKKLDGEEDEEDEDVPEVPAEEEEL